MATAQYVIPFLVCIIQAGDQQAARWPNLYSQALEDYNRGDFYAAGEIARPAYRSWRNAPGSAWHWRFRLLLADSLVEGDRTTDALPLLTAQAPDAGSEAHRLAALAFLRYRTKQDDEARRLLDAAAAINPKPAREVAGRIEMIRGNLELDGNAAAAEACFRRALDLAPPGSLLETYALIDLGVFDLFSFRNDEATVWLQRARALAARAGMKRSVALADLNLGVSFHRLGDLDVAFKYFDEAASIDAELHDRVNLVRVLINEGEAAFDTGENEKAREFFDRARRFAAPGKDDNWIATSLVDLSEVALAKRDSAQAEELNQAAGVVAKRIDDKSSLLDQMIQAGEIAAARQEYGAAESMFNSALALAHTVGDPVGQWQCHAGLASINRASGRVSAAEREYRLAIETIEGERSKLSHDEFKFSFLSHLIHFYDDYIEFLLQRGDAAAAFRVAQSSRGSLLARNESMGAAHGSALDLSALQRALRSSGSVLLSYWLAPARSLVWVLDGATLQVLPLPPEPEISQRVNQYAAAIRRDSNPLQTANPAGQWLFATLIPPQYRSRARLNVVLQPDGSLHGLNFESLPDAQGRFWIEDATVSIAPSLAILRQSANAPQRRLLMFGDPAAGNDVPRLPSLQAELDAVAKHYADKRLYTAADATPAAYLDSHAETFSTLHFAAHAVANPESPLDSAILLAGPPESRKLYAREVLDRPLTAELVTLSACETAGNRAYYGEGLIGFSWAFLSAGARNVVAGLWQVDDHATAQLMAAFYDAISSGLPPAAALRKAKLDLMASSPIYHKPRYWAAFETFTRALYR